MAFFHPARIKEFFTRHNLNNLFHEIGATILGMLLGLYAYEKRDEIFGLLGMEGGKPFTFNFPESWTRPENRGFFIAGIVLAAIILLIKLLLYFRWIDLNRWFSNRRAKGRGVDVNGIIQELCTLIMGTVFGLFSSPVSKRVGLVFEKAEYPDPVPGIIVLAVCLVVKLLLYSQTLNFNLASGKKGKRAKIFAPGALATFFGKVDWNDPIKNLLSVLIGVGIGLYLYQSNLIFVFEEQYRAIKSKASEVMPVVQRLLGPKHAKEAAAIKKSVSLMPASVSEKEKRPYWIAGLIMVVGAALLKLLMYLAILNWNAIRDGIFGNKGSTKGRSPGRDYNGIIDEILMLFLSMIMGVLATPLFNNLRGQATPYPYGGVGVALLALLVVIKVLFMFGVFDFNKKALPRKKAARKKRYTG